MNDQFDWVIGDERDGKGGAFHSAASRWAARSIWFLLVTAVFTAIILSSWYVGRNRLAQSEAKASEAVQHILDLEQDAFLRGDGDLYFSLHSPDSDWIPAQFSPINIQSARAGFQVTRAETHDDFIWANLSWAAEDAIYQRIAFFQWQGDQLVHMATAPNYWGSWKAAPQPWGELIFTETDEEWALLIADFVAETVDEICWRTCLDGRLPFTLHLANDFGETAVPHQLRIPSPRLLALDENGQPADLFWELLRQRVEAYLSPAVIRFAVPPTSFQNEQNIVDYDQAAQRFMTAHPDIVIELIHLDEWPNDPAALVVEFDGAGVVPTADMLAAGLVHDLTDYIDTDPDFDEIDFFPQIWQGASWQGRTWFMPQAASMHLLYYDKAAYQQARLPEPSLRWTWKEMEQDVAALIPAQPESSDLAWGILDVGLDSLFSYAYNWNNQCTEAATILCQHPLQPQNVAAALEWYSQMVAQPAQMPDLTSQLSDLLGEASMSYFLEDMEANRQMQFVLMNIQTGHRKAAIWVDVPMNYEFQLLLANLGVVPFPGSDRFDGITPLWVQGSFISQGSERPLAVWQWLKFLSYQQPTSRLVPARPSVSTGMGFWTYLPRPLGDAMRTAFPFSRPVLIEEKNHITWERVTAVLSGEATPLQAAQNRPALHWFASTP